MTDTISQADRQTIDVFELIAHGDDEHRSWLRGRLLEILPPVLTAAADQRQAEIVAWLRSGEAPVTYSIFGGDAVEIADAIESGTWRIGVIFMAVSNCQRIRYSETGRASEEAGE